MFPLIRWTDHLSITKTVFWFSLWNFASSSCTYSSNNALLIQPFCRGYYQYGNDLTFLRYRIFWGFQIRLLEVCHQLHLLLRDQWFLFCCAFNPNTCSVLRGLFCPVYISRKGQIFQCCKYEIDRKYSPVLNPGKGGI